MYYICGWISTLLTIYVGGCAVLARTRNLLIIIYLYERNYDCRCREYIDITKPIAESVPLISIDGNAVCSAGNISAIVGEAKSKKTFLTTVLVASAIAYRFKSTQAFKNISNNITLNVLWLDTEQSEGHVRKVIDRINTITGVKRTNMEDECPF